MDGLLEILGGAADGAGGTNVVAWLLARFGGLMASPSLFQSELVLSHGTLYGSSCCPY